MTRAERTDGRLLLDPQECLELLGRTSLGRIGITFGALPVVLPVRYRLVGDRIVFCTEPGTRLAAATSEAVVAFQVDDIDPELHVGSTVVVTTVAHRVLDPARLAELEAAGIPGADGSGRQHVVELPTTMLSGRRVLG